MKNKILTYIKKINMPMIAFSAITIRSVVYGAGIGDALVVFAIAGVYGYHRFLTHKNFLWNTVVESEITQLKNAVESLKHKTNARTMYEKREQKGIRKF